MRCSVLLAFLVTVDNVAYGFSQAASSSPAGWTTRSAVTVTAPATIPSTTMTQQVLLPLVPRGGAATKVYSTPSSDTTPTSGGSSKGPASGIANTLASLWGTTGVLYILAKAIKRVLPIALEPFQGKLPALSQFELGAYIVTCLWFAYVEGYKGFQQKFSPLVVKRSFTLIPGQNGTNWMHFLLAPLYSMGLIYATKKRTIVSWSVTIGVAAIVAAVKRLPYPWRNIVDAGVVVGLTWGSISIALNYIKSWVTGAPPSQVSAELPKSVTEKAS